MKEQFIISRDVARAIAALEPSERWAATYYALHYGFGDVPVSDNPAYDTITRGIDRANKNVDKATPEDIIAIVGYLNLRHPRRRGSYKASTASTRSLINARFNEGFTREDFYTVIKQMSEEWSGTKFERYYRPQTLFSPKFESYLNHAKANEQDSSFDVKDYYEAAIARAYGGGI